MQREVIFESADEAVQHCFELIQQGAADLFRGQANDWPMIIPSLFRGTVDVQNQARVVLAEFKEWANVVPQMAIYHRNDRAITAIAQHYGIPTALLDLTTDPRIAELFARGMENGDDTSDDAVIYCFKREELERLEGFNIVEIDVLNLWRLQAQNGLFLEYADNAAIEQVRRSAICVRFPRRSITPPETVRLYPLRKSVLETVIDQWIYRHEIQKLFTMFSQQRVLMIRRYTYPGVFRWREVPEFEPNWLANNPGWIFPNAEHVDEAIQGPTHSVGLDSASDVIGAFKQLKAQFEGPIKGYAKDGRPIGFALHLPAGHEDHEHHASVILNRCWDGIRAHPYRIESGVSGMAAIALALIRPILHPDAENWEERLWGETETIDVAPVGGHIDSGSVSRDSFNAARYSKYNALLTKYAQRKLTQDPLYLFNYVVDPWVLFDFSHLSAMLVQQFIPSCVGWYWKESLENNDGVPGELWGVSFNAALLATITRFGWRFFSPISTEQDVERVILISEDMLEDEIEEIFISCLPPILRKEKPFVVKFIDYGRDERPIWQIERAIELCKIIDKFGGISVLDVFPGASDFGSPASEDDPGGLGAFHIWAIANGKNSGDMSQFEVTKPILEEFWKDLLLSNAKLDQRAKAEPDWPLSGESA